jgi:hypothetical protein
LIGYILHSFHQRENQEIKIESPRAAMGFIDFFIEQHPAGLDQPSNGSWLRFFGESFPVPPLGVGDAKKSFWEEILMCFRPWKAD